MKRASSSPGAFAGGFNLHYSTEAIQTWHGQSVTSRTIPQKYMTADPMTCPATRKWRPSKSTIRWRWSREKRSSRCARSATIRWIEYFARRFRECLDRLALIYGFATERR
jgi:hypothetical protein